MTLSIKITLTFLALWAPLTVFGQPFDKTAPLKSQPAADIFDEAPPAPPYFSTIPASLPGNGTGDNPATLTEPLRFPLQHPDASNNWACPVALANGDLLLFWSAFGDLAFSRSSDSGQTWESPGVIAFTPGFVPNFPEAICTPTGRAIITWSDTQTRELMRSYSDDNGISWSGPEQITFSGRNERWTSLNQTLDGTLWLFYADYVGGNARDIFYRTSSDNGDTWSAEQTFRSTTADEQYAAVISADPSTLLTFYSDNSGGNYSIYQVSSGDGGQTWSPPMIIGEVYQDEYRPRPLRRSNGTLELVYVANLPAPVLPNTLQNDIYSISSSDGGNSWSLPQRFTQYAGADGSHSAVLLNDQPFVTFISSRRAANFNQNQIWYGIIGVTVDSNPPPALLNRQILSPLPGQPVLARAFVDDESGISGVAISYSLDGLPAGPFPMYDDGMHHDNNPGDNIWGADIGPFQIGDTIAYSFSISDISANTVQISGGSFDMPVVHSAGNVILSLYENAKLADETNVIYRSAYWPASGGHDYLYLGGLWVGAEVFGEQRVMNLHYPNLGGIDWAHTAGTPTTVVPGVSDQDISLRYDDQLAQSAPIGLQVHQESYQWSGATRDDFIIFRYTIKNTGLNGDLNNVYAAVWLDPDISSQTLANDDMGGYDFQRGLAYLYDPGQNPAGYLGLKLLGAIPYTANLHSNNDPTTDAQRFQFMTAGILPNANYPSDWRILLTAPPFYLAAGDSYTVAFGLVMGGSQELQANADTMATLYEQIWGVPRPLLPPGNLIALDKFDGEVALYWDWPGMALEAGVAGGGERGARSEERGARGEEPEMFLNPVNPVKGLFPEISGNSPAPEGSLLGFSIYRQGSDPFFTQIGIVPPFQYHFLDHGVANGQVYQYYLTAVYSNGESAPSNITTGYPMSLPNAPGKAVSHARPGGRPYGIAFDGSSVWMTDYNYDQIRQFDPNTWQFMGQIPAPGGNGCYGMAWDGAYLWVAHRLAGGVYQIDLAGNILQFLDVPPGINGGALLTGLAYENGYIWVMDRYNFVVHKFDAASGVLLQTLSMPAEFLAPASPQGLGYWPDRGTFMVGLLTYGASKTRIYEVTTTDFTLTGRDFEFNMEYDPGNGEFYSSIRGGLAFNPLTGNYWIGDVWTDMVYEVHPFPMVEFADALTVSDNNGNSLVLVFGIAQDASDGFDPQYDQLAPPPPPTGAFDARFQVGGIDLLKDFRGSAGNITWEVYYLPSSGGEPVTLTWGDVGQIPGRFALVDWVTNGVLVNIDMRTTNSFTDLQGFGHMRIVYSRTEYFNQTVAQGWNLLSLPGQVADPFYLAVFPNAQPGTLFGFSGSYYSAEMMELMRGYWLRFPTGGEVGIINTSFYGGQIDLLKGWNMIGGPSCAVPLAEVSDPGGIIIPGTLYGYDGSYFPIDTLYRGDGYWIRASEAGAIFISCAGLAGKIPGAASALLFDPARFSKIELRDATPGSGRAQILYFAGKLENPETRLSFSLPPLPPAGGFDARFADDYRLSEAEEALIRVQSSHYPLTLRFSNLKLDESWQYVLTELAGTREIGRHPVSEGETILIGDPQTTALRLHKVAGVPKAFAVSQNYPNPFNPVTEIRYALPQPEKVEIVIYNAPGQKVKTLVSRPQPAGYYTVAWDATNDAGHPVGSGIYFYRVKAGKHSAMKKMALVR